MPALRTARVRTRLANPAAPPVETTALAWYPTTTAALRPSSPPGKGLHRASDTGAVTLWDGAAWRAFGADTYTRAEVDTTDATWTTIATATLAQSSCVTFSGMVSAIRDDGTEGGSWTFTAHARRPASGVPVMGTVLFGLTAADDATWDVRVQVSGNDVVVQVMGAAAKTVTWRAEVQTTEAKL